ncbi:MAG: hypothetical protein ABI164_01860, partial [Acidobacteriaceae bacterium]
GTKDVASVALFRSYPSITYNNSSAGLSAILVEQALIQAKVPFHLIFEEQLGHLSPDTCKVLILPDSECLSDEQLAMIRKFVDAGGGLIATEQAGLYDQWRRLRVKPGLEGLVDNQTAAAPYQEQVKMVPIVAEAPVRKEFGRGRVAYLSGIEFDGALPPHEPYFNIGPAFWKRPKNWKDLVDAVSWVAQGDVPLHVTGPDFLGVNLVEQPEKRFQAVHLVNYNRQVRSLENIQVQCAMPEGKSPSAVRLYSVDWDAYKTLDFKMRGSNAVFTVPKMNTYCMAVLSFI